MTDLELALHYFRLSNQRDLEAIEVLFHPDATYSSDKQGLFFGVNQIMAMMRPFFAQYAELEWTVESTREPRPHIVEIDFGFQGTTNDGGSQARKGLESLILKDGKIRHIEVRARHSS